MKNKPKQTIALTINPDTTPVLFTDEIHMSTNDFGVTMDVIQKMGNGEEGRIVARLGMSRDHALAFTNELGKLLMLTEKKKGAKLN